MSILLVRHGQTRDNFARVVQLPDAPLSEAGLQQAGALQKAFHNRHIYRVLCSDYLRTRQTAGQALPDFPHVEYSALLRERNFGALRGRAYAELDADIMAPDYHPPEGESWQAFEQRLDQTWQLISEAYQPGKGDLVVITHGLVCHGLAHKLFADESLPQRWDNTAITELELVPALRLTRVNCTAHLDGLTFEEGAQV